MQDLLQNVYQQIIDIFKFVIFFKYEIDCYCLTILAHEVVHSWQYSHKKIRFKFSRYIFLFVFLRVVNVLSTASRYSYIVERYFQCV